MNVIKRLIIPIDKHIDRISTSIRKGSNTDVICITLTEQGLVYNLDGVDIAAIKGLKPDGTEFYNTCTICGNEIHYSVTGQSVNIKGITRCELVLFDVSGDKIVSADFELRIYDELFDDSVIESSSQYTAIEAILASMASTKAAVDETAAHIDEMYAELPDAAFYRGTLGSEESGADYTELPTSYRAGYHFKVISDGTYAGQTCEAGDFIYATVRRSGAGNLNSDWSVLQKNIVGALTDIEGSESITISGSGHTRTISVAASGVDAGSYGDSSDQSPDFGDTVTIYQITVDSTGRITDVDIHALEIPHTMASSVTDGLMSSSDKNKLDNIEAQAEVNQNAFSIVKVGNTNVEADSATDTLELKAGTNVTLTPDAPNNKVTITSKNTEYSVHTDTDMDTGIPYIQLLNEETVTSAGNIKIIGSGSAKTSVPTGEYYSFEIKTPEGMADVYCDTADETAAKIGHGYNFELNDHARFTILLTHDNEAESSVTLNIDNTGAYPVYLNGSAISSNNYEIPAGVHEVYFDPVNDIYHIRTDGKITASVTGDAATVNGKTVEENVPSGAKFTDEKVAYTSDSSSNTLLPIVLANGATPTTPGGVKYNSNIHYNPSTNTLDIYVNGVGHTYITLNAIELFNSDDYRSFAVKTNIENKDVPVFYYNDSSDDGFYTLTLPKKSGTIATDDCATTESDGLMSASDKVELARLSDATALNGIISGLENYQGTLGMRGTISQLPTRYDIGWFWRVITPGTYAGIECKYNDLLVAMVERHDTGNLDADWSRIRPVNGNITISSWADFPAIIRAGIHERICECGDVVTLRYNNTDVPCQIIGINIGTNATNAKLKNSIRFQPINNLVEKEFDTREAFYSQDTVLPAGTYHFKVGAYTWKTDEQNKYYQFTLTEDVPADGQLIFSQDYNATFANAYVRVYAKGSPDKLDEATMTEGTGGTDLGTLNNTLQTNINSSQRTVLGNNRYSQSNIRVWLNAAPDAEPGTIWEPQNKWDRCPGWLRTDASFQSLVDPNLLAVVGTSKLTVAKNTLCDGGGSETVNDKFFLLSRDEVYGGKEISSVTEGLTCQFYSKYSALSAAGTGADANRKKKTGASFKYWWLRTPLSGYSSYARNVYTDGSVSYYYARYSYGLAPAWDIY